MPAIPLKRIITFSSEDVIHKASNLLSPSAGLHWASSPDYRSKCLTVELEMAKQSKIVQIEVGNLRSAFVEVLVSDCPPDGLERIGYVSLLPQSLLMTAEESKNGRNTTRTKLFSQDKLSKAAIDKKWKYIKIQCLQPYLFDKPYGLRYIKLFQTHTQSVVPESGSPSVKRSLNSLLSPPTGGHPKLLPFSTPQHTRTLESPQSKRGSFSTPGHPPRTPKLPSLSTSSRGENSRNSTPKRPRKEEEERMEDSQEFEFAGLEDQSRLLKNTLKGDKELLDANPILSRIAEERNKEEISSGYVRRKLLHKELNCVENKGIDFVSSYDEKSADRERSRMARLYSSMKISKLDDSCEMGAEPSPKSFTRGKRSAKTNTSGWVKRRGRKRRENVPIVDLIEMPLISERKQSNLFDFYMNCTSGENNSDKTSTEPMVDLTIGSHTTEKGGGTSEGEGKQSCPICEELVPVYALELHANMCAERTFDKPSCTIGSSGSEVASNVSSNSHITVSRRGPNVGIVYLD